MAIEKTEDRSVYRRLRNGLPDLLRDLRKLGYKAGVDQYLSAQNLILIWEQQPLLSPDIIRASLAALFCTSFDEQQRFRNLFHSWYASCISLTPAEESEASECLKPPKWAETVSLDKKARLAIVLWALLAMLVIWRFCQNLEQPVIKSGIKAPVNTETTNEKKPKAIVLPDYIPDPRLPPEPVIVPEQFYFKQMAELKTSFALPFIIWFGWFMHRLRLRYLTLSKRRRQSNEKIRLEYLRFRTGETLLFPARALKAVWHAWRGFQPFRSRRLHNARTVRRTLEKSGYFEPVFRDRLLPPEHVLIIDRRHQDDFSARLGHELKLRMQAEGLFIAHYQYDTDPRYCWPSAQQNRSCSLQKLASRHEGQHLIVIGEARSFYRAFDGEPLFRSNVGVWSNKTLLTVNSPEEWGEAEHQLIQQGFRITPFTRRGITRLLESIQFEFGFHEIRRDRSLDYRDAPLPEELQHQAYTWLDDRRPEKKWQQKILRGLKGYLGREGFCLLAAIAAYPSLSWPLTLALDCKLHLEGDENREIRLRKLARLAWFRNGKLPDVWRRIILRSVEPAMLKSIYECYQVLFNGAKGRPAETLIELPVAVPDLASAGKDQREWINTAGPGDPLQDYVFASVIRGRKPGLLEFTLPIKLKHWFPPQYWRGLIVPVMLSMLIVAGMTFGIAKGWQHWGDRLIEQQALANMREQLALYPIVIQYEQSELEKHAYALKTVLNVWGFEVTQVRFLPTVKSENANSIEVAQSVPADIIDSVSQRLNYQTYGAKIDEEITKLGPGVSIRIILRQAYQPLSIYRDFIDSTSGSTGGGWF